MLPGEAIAQLLAVNVVRRTRRWSMSSPSPRELVAWPEQRTQQGPAFGAWPVLSTVHRSWAPRALLSTGSAAARARATSPFRDLDASSQCSTVLLERQSLRDGRAWLRRAAQEISR